MNIDIADIGSQARIIVALVEEIQFTVKENVALRKELANIKTNKESEKEK